MRDAKERLTCPALVLLTEEDGVGAPLGALTTLLAQTIVEDFGDATVVVELDGDGAAGGAVPRVSLRAPADLDGTVTALREAMPALARRAAYAFLDISRRSRAFQLDLARRLGDVDLGPVAGRAVHLTRSKTAPSLPGWSLLRTDLLAPRPEAQRAAGMRRAASATRGLLTKEMARLTGMTPEVQGESYPPTRITHAAITSRSASRGKCRSCRASGYHRSGSPRLET